MLPDLKLDDKLKLRKPHPCGSYEWKVVRLGADIGIECLGCGRRVMLPRRQLARRIKSPQPERKQQTEPMGPAAPSLVSQPATIPHPNPAVFQSTLPTDEPESI
jgi:hypothetical protein